MNINESLEEFRKSLELYGLQISDASIDYEESDFTSFGGNHFQVAGRSRLDITLQGDTNPQTFTRLSSDLKSMNKIRQSKNPSVQELFEQIQVIMELSDDNN